MVYIPNEWIKDKSNADRVYDILDKLDYDIKVEGESVEEGIIKELNDIGETIIIEKYKSGQISFGA